MDLRSRIAFICLCLNATSSFARGAAMATATITADTSLKASVGTLRRSAMEMMKR